MTGALSVESLCCLVAEVPLSKAVHTYCLCKDAQKQKVCDCMYRMLIQYIPMMPSVRHFAAPCWPHVFHCPRIRWRFRSERPSTGGSSSTRWSSPCTAAPSWHWGPGILSDTPDRRRTRLGQSTLRTPSAYDWPRRSSASPGRRGPSDFPRAALPPPGRSDTSVRRMPSGRTSAGAWFLTSERAVSAR